VNKEYEGGIYDCCLVGKHKVMLSSIELGGGGVQIDLFFLTYPQEHEIHKFQCNNSNKTENMMNQSVVFTYHDCIKSDPHPELFSQLMDFHETSFEHHSIRDYHTFISFNSVPSIIPTLKLYQLGRRE
jgi:hypothetical protein